MPIYNVANAASTLKQFSVAIKLPETKVQVPTLDFVSSFKQATAATINSANLYTVDVFPNMVPILMFIEYNCSKTITTIDDRTCSKVTLPNYVAYCLSLVYGHILIHDMYIRPDTSVYAADYFNVTSKNQFAHKLLTLPVPTFLEPILEKLTPTVPPHSSNIFFCPSAAGLTIETHFGRFFPINMFTKIHDFTAELNSRITPSVLNASLHSQVLFTIEKFFPDKKPFSCAIGNLIGSLRSPTFDMLHQNEHTYPSYQSKLRQSFDSTYNPVLLRDYTRRNHLAPVNIVSPTFTTPHPNPYDILFAYTPTNFTELPVIFHAIGARIIASSLTSKSLAEICSAPSGTSILTHGYSTFALPTWHSVQILPRNGTTSPEHIKVSPTEIRQHSLDVAFDLKFLIPPTASDDQFQFELPLSVTKCTVDDKHPVNITPAPASLTLVSHPDEKVAIPAANEFVLFDEEHDPAPTVLVLNPSESDTETAWKATAFGMVIESFEIDGCVFPHPNSAAAPATENARFLESAIPYDLVKSHLRYNTVSETSVRTRALEKRNAFKAATIKYDYSKCFLPQYAARMLQQLNYNHLPTFTYVPHVTLPHHMAQFYCYKIESPAHQDQDDRLPPNVSKNSIFLWSPYSYTPNPPSYSNPHSRSGKCASSPRCYFISNLRTMFGTDPQLITCHNALTAMPIA